MNLIVMSIFDVQSVSLYNYLLEDYSCTAWTIGFNYRIPFVIVIFGSVLISYWLFSLVGKTYEIVCSYVVFRDSVAPFWCFNTCYYKFHFNVSEMSPEQQKKLIEIRKKKQELLLEIQVSLLLF